MRTDDTVASGGKDRDIEEIILSEERFTELEEAEQFILSITENGYGKRSSAYEYRLTNRGGSGIVNIITNKRNGKVVDSFPVEAGDQIMLMTNTAKIIRTPVRDIRIAGRNTQGVTLFNIEKGEKIVTAVRINESMAAGDDDTDDVNTNAEPEKTDENSSPEDSQS